MREIKFRAWTDKAMISEFLPCGNSQAVYIHSGNEIKIINNCILMQYTGLNDNNGKEIYEGDIIHHGQEETSGEYNEVIFQNGLFGMRWQQSSLWHILNDSHSFEVIGNIYENPELIKL